MTSRSLLSTAVALTFCCLTACGGDVNGPDDKRGKDPLRPGADPCASVDPAQCDSTKGCALVTACPECPPGVACAALCTVSCQSIPVPPPPPPPSVCDGLDEATCKATAGCEPLYGGVCPMCVSGTNCPPCTSGFLGCAEVKPPPADPCAGLDERACNMASGCQGVYAPCPPNARCACPAGVDCDGTPAIFKTCQQDVVMCGGTGSTEPKAPPPGP